jgi:putative transposase
MREDNLLSLRAKPFVPRTTDSRHGFAVRSNLTRGLTPTGLDQIWVADITYVRLAETFVYLAVVIDAFSRKVVGFALDDHLEARLALAALDQAIAARNPAPDSLIHHSDRGVQGGFKRSSQHDLCRLIGETGQAPLRVSSNQASFWAAS